MRVNNAHLTPQEHRLYGSTPHAKYHLRPYTPLAVQDGMSIEECNNIRARNNYYSPAITSLYNVRGFNGEARIFSLDENGDSLEDPILVKTDGEDILIDSRKDFPFPRQGPRVELESEVTL